MIKLLVKSSEESRELEFNGQAITIGRSSECVLKLDDKKASRHHCKIEKVDGEYRVFDLESGNGTKLNGRDLKGSAGLNKGDEIQVGFSTLYVLNLDAPAKAAAASPPPLPVAAVAPPPPPLPAAASTPSKDEPKRSPITRRHHYARSSSSGGLVAVVAVLLIAGAIFFAASRMGGSIGAPSAGKPKAVDKKAGPTINEANEAFQSFKAKTGTGTPTEEHLAEADRMSDRYGEILPDFRQFASELRTRRNENISKMNLEQVKPLVDKAVAEQRFGDAIDALKALRGGPDAEGAGKLLVAIEAKVAEEYKGLNEGGNKLVAEKKYLEAAEHYQAAAPKFRNTQHYKTVLNKPENLMEMARAETAAAKSKEARAKAEADAALAKAETPKPEPKPEMKPEMPAPKPAMKPEMPAPKPAMPKPEMPKPEMKPPPPPPPPPPKEEPKPEPKPAEGVKTALKKPDVLCDCKKIAKGTFCVKCDRVLGPDDIRGGACKKCDEKPKKVDMCVKRYFQAECHPEKISDKPVFCDGKVHDLPHEDRARIAYLCESCGENGEVQSEIKHGAECKNRLTVAKICMKSGTAPHAPDKK